MKKILCISIFCYLAGLASSQNVVYVSPQGNDQATGTLKTPVATLQHALLLAQKGKAGTTKIQLLPGTHYLDQTLRIESRQLTGKSLYISASPTGRVTLSGGKRVQLKWQKAEGKLWKAYLDNPAFEQLFVNDQQQILARYPNYSDTVRIFGGFAADALAPERIKRWKNPAGGFVHAMHAGQWAGPISSKFLGFADKQIVHFFDFVRKTSKGIFVWEQSCQPQHIHSCSVQESRYSSLRWVSDGHFIFFKNGILHPMQFILYAPMSSDSPGDNLYRVERFTQNVKAELLVRLSFPKAPSSYFH